MDIRPLKTIAICFGLTAAMLASQAVSPALGTPVVDIYVSAEANAQMGAFLKTKKALGGMKGINALSESDRGALSTCLGHDWCRDHFGGKISPSDLGAVNAKLRTPAD
jgi:hypothetical protein